MNASEGRSCGKGRMNAVSLLCGHLSAGGEMQAYTVLPSGLLMHTASYIGAVCSKGGFFVKCTTISDDLGVACAGGNCR